MNEKTEFSLLVDIIARAFERLLLVSGWWAILGAAILVCVKWSLLANYPWYYCSIPLGIWLIGSVLNILAIYTYLCWEEQNIGE